MNAIERAEAVRELAAHRGWQAFIETVQNEVNETLVACPLASDFANLQYLRGRLEMAQDTLSWLDRTIKQGEAASAELAAEVHGAADR